MTATSCFSSINSSGSSKGPRCFWMKTSSSLVTPYFGWTNFTPFGSSNNDRFILDREDLKSETSFCNTLICLVFVTNIMS